MEIKNAHFLITGGSSGIGKETAQKIINKGGIVAITGRDLEKLEKVAKEIGAIAIHADASTEEGVEKTYEVFQSKIGRLDCLINNAGFWGGNELHELEISLMRKVYDTNVFGAAMMGSKAAQIFREQKSGNIINIASTAATKGYARGTIYASSKFALRGMTQCWAAELRPFNVRVTLINPSEVTTAFGNDARIEREDVNNKLRSEEIAHTIISALEMDDRGYIPEVTVFATNPW